MRDNEKIPRKRKHDPHDHIEVIDPVNVPDPKLQWIISGSDSRISNQGTYSLSSLPPLISKLKKIPLKFDLLPFINKRIYRNKRSDKSAPIMFYIHRKKAVFPKTLPMVNLWTKNTLHKKDVFVYLKF